MVADVIAPAPRRELPAGVRHHRARAWAVVLPLLAVVFWVSRARQPTETDSVNLLLGLHHYDVRLQQPHPPGYPLVVAAAHLLTWTGSGLRAYEIFALLCSLIGLVATSEVARYWWGPRAGYVAGAAVVATPLFAYYASTVSVYPAEVAITPLLVLACARTARRDRAAWVIAVPLLFAVGVGLRPTVGPLLLPVMAGAVWYGRPRVRTVVVGCLAGLVVVAAWALPMLARSGGLSGWLHSNDAQALTTSATTSLLSGASFSAWLFNVEMAVTGALAVAAPVVTIVVIVHLCRRRTAATPPDPTAAVASPAAGSDQRPGGQPAVLLILWALPYLLVYSVVHFGKPGYAEALLPPFAVAAGGFVARRRAGRREHRGEIVAIGFAGVVVLAWAVAPVLALPWRLDEFLPTQGALAQQDTEASGLARLAQHCPAATCTIVSTGSSQRYWFHEPISLERYLVPAAHLVRLADARAVTGEVYWVGANPPAAVIHGATAEPSIGSWRVLRSTAGTTTAIAAALPVRSDTDLRALAHRG